MFFKTRFTKAWYQCLSLASLLVATSTVSADAVPVSVISPQQSALVETLRLSGTVTALRRADLSVRVDGLVSDILVDAGTAVEQDQALLQQDATLARITYQQALAARDEVLAVQREASRLLSEAERLRVDKHLSENEVNIRRANVAQANAALTASRARVSLTEEDVTRHTLVAPFAGVISQRSVDRGEWLNRGDTAFELVSPKEVVIDVNVPQERFADVSTDTTVNVCPDTLPGRCVSASVAAIIPVGDTRARTFRVRLASKGETRGLLPGSSATAVFALETQNRNQLLIPRDALLRHPDGRFSVFVLQNGVASRRAIELGNESGGQISVTSGLRIDDQVVVRGNELLSEGQAVSIVDEVN